MNAAVIFKQMMNMTITEYLLEYRLSRSMELLEKKDLNISEIAEMTGFCTVSYYITAFKRKTGDTPLEYRKKRSISALSQKRAAGYGANSDADKIVCVKMKQWGFTRGADSDTI